MIKELCSWTVMSLSCRSNDAKDIHTQVWCIQSLANGIFEFLPRYPGGYELAQGTEITRRFGAQRDVELALDRGRRRKRHGRDVVGKSGSERFAHNLLLNFIHDAVYTVDARMDRPVTSKSRGICRYYTTPRGCFAGDDCKFLHGADEKLTPYDKAKVCRYYARGTLIPLVFTACPNPIPGHCTRGDRCWFRHVLPKVALDDERIQFNSETCCICLEKPTAYGLLSKSPAWLSGRLILSYAQQTAVMYSVSRSIHIVPHLMLLTPYPVYPSMACSCRQITRCRLVGHDQVLSTLSHTISLRHTVRAFLSEWQLSQKRND